MQTGSELWPYGSKGVQRTPEVGDEPKLSFSYSLYLSSGRYVSDACLSSRCGASSVGLSLLHTCAVKGSDGVTLEK